MRRFPKTRQIVLAIVAGLAFVATGWAQDANPPETANSPETVESTAPEPATDEAEDSNDIDVDDGSYLDGEEDDFRPSEEIGADQSIPFPTDI
jgi:hypothetical protein